VTLWDLSCDGCGDELEPDVTHWCETQGTWVRIEPMDSEQVDSTGTPATSGRGRTPAPELDGSLAHIY
jgi:hypothetical protein